MRETSTFDLALLGATIALASMFSVWVLTGRSMGAWGTTVAAALVVLCTLGERARNRTQATAVAR